MTAVGIDLGTSNSAIAIISGGIKSPEVLPHEVSSRERSNSVPSVLPIPQLLTANSVGNRAVLPSALYIPYSQEFAHGGPALPWSRDEQIEDVIGELARDRAQVTPERVITSAKSWLCNTHVDRKADILPWKAEGIERRYSPFEATRRYLLHLNHALRHHFEGIGEHWYDASGQSREIVLTVPASFDEVARQLTLEAAKNAGFEDVVLLEEPQAAFYAWISGNRGSSPASSHGETVATSDVRQEDWRSQVSAGDVILVCDVGGGTADFTLIAIGETQGELKLERVSVGDHILLGGDNMDLALAFSLRQTLESEGHKLDTWQFRSLIHGARDAKERLLGGATHDDSAADAIRIGIASRGSNLFAEAISVSVTGEQATRSIVDGFFPIVPPESRPRERTALGLQELGLRYAHDAAITRHLAKFLADSYHAMVGQSHLQENQSCLRHDRKMVLPTAVLFNGGVFKSKAIRQRVLEQLRTWGEEVSIRELTGQDLDLAVAIGAAYYAEIRSSGKGVKIRSGLAHSYYLGLESSEPAIPGYEPPLKGVCVAAQGMEEGSHVKIPEQRFGLLTNEAVHFRLFSSPRRPFDLPGTVIDDIARLAEESATVEATLRLDASTKREMVPVYLTSEVTEIGTMGLYLQQSSPESLHDAEQERVVSSPDKANRWRLEFNVRGERHS